MELYHVSSISGLKIINPRVTTAYKHMGSLVFASPSLAFASCFGGYWSEGEILTEHSEDTDEPKYYNVKSITLKLSNSVNLKVPCTVYKVNITHFTPLEYYDGLEYISRREVRVIKSETLLWEDLLRREGIKIVRV